MQTTRPKPGTYIDSLSRLPNRQTIPQGDSMGLTIFRILLGFVLPPPLLVATFFLITDAFYFNRDAEYLRGS